MFTRKLPAGAGTLERRAFPVDLRKIWIFAAALIRAPNEAPLLTQHHHGRKTASDRAAFITFLKDIIQSQIARPC